MPVYTSAITLKTQGFCDIRDVTSRVEQAVAGGKARNGIVTVFVPGATAGLTTIEYEGWWILITVHVSVKLSYRLSANNP
jgi:thiamine phosphate synthase YjbQ (UPF0047 family)